MNFTKIGVANMVDNPRAQVALKFATLSEKTLGPNEQRFMVKIGATLFVRVLRNSNPRVDAIIVGKRNGSAWSFIIWILLLKILLYPDPVRCPGKRFAPKFRSVLYFAVTAIAKCMVVNSRGQNLKIIQCIIIYCIIFRDLINKVNAQIVEKKNPSFFQARVHVVSIIFVSSQVVSLEERVRFELTVLQLCRLLRWTTPPPIH